MECDPQDFTIFTVPERFVAKGDPHAGMDAASGSLEALLEMAARDEAAGLGDAPWPPHFRRMEGEGKRVAPSRAKKAAPKQKEGEKAPAARPAGRRQSKMPLLVIANSPDKQAALDGLERWKQRHSEAAKLLAVDDVLVDSMRGSSSTWTRIRVNLRHVPEALRPLQETPDPDDDPTRKWRESYRSKDETDEKPKRTRRKKTE
jgi:hypothetical protein